MLDAKTGTAYPSRSYLSEKLNIDEAHIRRSIRNLEKRKFLIVVEAGTNRRAARYALCPDAIMAAREGASTGTAGVPLQAPEGGLYRLVRGASTGTAGVPLQAPEGQLSASEVQTKRQTKLSASPTLTRLPDGRALAGARPKRNAWRETLRNGHDE
jgi:DNA-binding Lrp family transcriptional regulator